MCIPVIWSNHPGQFRLSFSLNHAQKFPSITLVKKRMVCQKIQGIDVFFIHNLLEDAAEWFHEKWQIPVEAYRESMEECLQIKAALLKNC